MNNNMEREIFDIYVDDIIPNRFQPRLTFDEKSLNELAESIKQHGIIQPLVVRKIGDKYEIIAGERRYKASQVAGFQKVPAVIMNLDDKQSAEVAVIENIQRKDLTALEEAESYKKLLDKGYLTQEQLAGRMGKAQATISNKLRLLGLTDEVKDALLNEKISERHARSLLSLKDPNAQREVLNKIMDNKLTVRQTDELVKTMTDAIGNTGTGDTVETLEFNSTVPPIVQAPVVPSITAPEIPIRTPVVEPVQTFVEPEVEPTIPFISGAKTDFDPISNIDINQIKQGAIDINPVQPTADVNALLGINGIPQAEPAPIKEPEPQMRFITPLEDEEANMEMQEPTVNTVPVVPEINPIIVPFTQQPVVEPPKPEVVPVPTTIVPEPVTVSEPRTYTDGLVKEFRQSNSPTGEANRIIPGDLRSAINNVREITRTLERNNFNIDVEEFDFENLYQIIIKIDK